MEVRMSLPGLWLESIINRWPQVLCSEVFAAFTLRPLSPGLFPSECRRNTKAGSFLVSLSQTILVQWPFWTFLWAALWSKMLPPDSPSFHRLFHLSQTCTVVWWFSQPLLDPTSFSLADTSHYKFLRHLTSSWHLLLEAPDLSVDGWPKVWRLPAWASLTSIWSGFPHSGPNVVPGPSLYCDPSVCSSHISMCSDPRCCSHSSLVAWLHTGRKGWPTQLPSWSRACPWQTKHPEEVAWSSARGLGGLKVLIYVFIGSIFLS